MLAVPFIVQLDFVYAFYDIPGHTPHFISPPAVTTGGQSGEKYWVAFRTVTAGLNPLLRSYGLGPCPPG